jgi:hypothetical protein
MKKTALTAGGKVGVRGVVRPSCVAICLETSELVTESPCNKPTMTQARVDIASMRQIPGDERTREMAECGEGSATDGCVMALRASARSAQSADCHVTTFSFPLAVVRKAVVLLDVALAHVVLAMSARTPATP